HQRPPEMHTRGRLVPACISARRFLDVCGYRAYTPPLHVRRLCGQEVTGRLIMAAAEKDLKRDRLYLRVSSRQREVISEAAEATQKDLSAFVLEAAIVQAQRVLADRRVFKLDKARWERFIRALDRPVSKPTEKPKLLE